jgi:predicted transcriptional regulator
MPVSEQEISVTGEGVVLKGEIVNDLRPVVRRGVKTADSVLRLIDNVVATPLDYLSNNIEKFRAKFQERFEEIPLERRVEPSMRIGTSVVKNVAYSADEPDIQELFANLLASASDASKADLVHPGFATVISELLPFEANLLMELSKMPRQVDLARIKVDFDDKEAVNRAISNLVRLGLLDWRDGGYDRQELQKLIGQQNYKTIDPERLVDTVLPLVNDVQKLKNQLIQQLQGQSHKRSLEVTAFGRNFVAAVRSEKQS